MKAFRTLVSGFLPACLGVALHAASAQAQTPSGGASSPPGSAGVTPSGAEPGADSTDPAAVPLPSTALPEYDLPPPSTRWNLLFTGLAVTGVSYGLALGSGYAFPDARMSNELKVPIVGPWMAIADTGCNENDPDCSTVMLVVTAILAGIDGVVQAGGLGIALESAFVPTSSSKPPAAKGRAGAAPSVHPVPYVSGRDGLGLGVVGTF